jgi:hypothetical protein
MMKKLTLATIVLLLGAVGTAIGQDVRYNFDKETDFSKFKTYKWVSIKDAEKLNDIMDKNVKDAIDAELSKKGLEKTDSDTADLYIGYQAAINQEKQYNTFNSGWGYGPGWYGGGWYGASGSTTSTTTSSTIHVGQLALDMNDSHKHDLVWRGVVSKTIDPNAKPDKQQKNLQKAVAKLLKNYPPEKKND